MERIYVGTLTVALEHRLMHGLSQGEQREIASGYRDVLAARLTSYAEAQGLPLSVDLDLVSVRAGCVEAKFKMFVTIMTAVASVMTIVVKYPDFRKALPVIVHDAANLYDCHVKDIHMACLAQARDVNISKYLYAVKQGDTLSRIVIEEWRISPDRSYKYMVATVGMNPQAFVDGDMNQLKVGATLAKPTDQMVKDAAGRG